MFEYFKNAFFLFYNRIRMDWNKTKALEKRVKALEEAIKVRDEELRKFQALVLYQLEKVKDDVFESLPTYVTPSPVWSRRTSRVSRMPPDIDLIGRLQQLKEESEEDATVLPK